MHKILLTVFSVLIILIGAALIVPSFIDWSQYKDQIRTQVAKGTGYELELNGPLKAAFLPYPHVTATNVTIDSAGAEGPYAFRGRVEEAAISLALLPLLSGNIAVSEIELIKPDLTVRQQNFEPSDDVSESSQTVNEIEDSVSEAKDSSAIQIDSFILEDARITYVPLDGEQLEVVIPELALQADTLYGPYEAEGSILYDTVLYNFDVESGAYSKTEAMPVTLNVDSDVYTVDFSGIVDTTKEVMSLQGETEISAKSLAQFNVPLKGALNAKGLLTASQDSAKLDNGSVTLGDAKATLNFSANGLGEGQTKIIDTNIAFSNAINLDDILGQLSETSKNKDNQKTAGNGNETAATQKSPYDYLPQTIELPGNMIVNASVQAPSITYKGESIQNAQMQANLNNGNLKGSLSAGQLPDQGSVSMNFALAGQSTSRNGAGGALVLANPSLTMNGDLNIASLKILVSDWLEMAEADLFDNPSIPNTLNGALNGSVTGNVITIQSPQLQAGQYDMRGVSLRYRNAATPEMTASVDNLDGANAAVSGTLGDTKQLNVAVSHPNAVKAIQIVKPEFNSTPVLTKPMNFKANVVMGENVININDMNAKLGDIDTSGKVTINTASDRPDIKATLKFGRLDTQALMGGEKSKGTPASSGASNTGANASSSGGAPWTREAIDTDWMRSMNIDIQATADTLVHGTWTVNSPNLDIALNNGTLTVRDVKGGLFGGSVGITGTMAAPQAGQPLSVDGHIKASDVNMDQLFKAATTQTKDRVRGQASFNLGLKANGLSSSALINSLSGNGEINTSEITIIGLDLAKLSEAISDESLTDLSAALRSMTNGGQTVFNPLSHPLTIREGTMPVENLTLQNPTATLTSNGYVSFSRWMMDLKNTVKITEPEDLPELTINIKGPLNNPEKNVLNDVIRSYVMGKYGDKINTKVNEKLDSLLGDKLKDSPARGLINNLLGVPQNQQPTKNTNTAPAVDSKSTKEEAPAETQTEQPATEARPVEEQPQTEQRQPSVEEQAIQGLMKAFGQ